jgi:hypothetical protein
VAGGGQPALLGGVYREAFAKAQAEVKDVDSEMAEVRFESKPSYPSFILAEDEPVVRHAKLAAESLGLKPTTVFSNAAWMPIG